MFSSLSRVARRHVAAVIVPAAMFAVLAAAAAGSIADAATPPEKLAASRLSDASAPSIEAAAPRRHANAEHPGVTQWQRARDGRQQLDTDHFLVQPPASARWAVQSGQ